MKKNTLPFGLFIMTLIVTDSKWPKTAATVGVPKFEQDENGVYLMEDHMNTVESQLVANETAIAAHAPALKAEQDARALAETNAAALQTKLTAAENALATASGKLTTAEAKITELDAKLTARATDEVEPGNTGAGAKNEIKQESISAARKRYQGK